MMSDTTERDPNCIFCKVIARQIPATIVREDEHSIAIRDINPQAPTHILILPKNHIANIGKTDSAEILGSLFLLAGPLAQQEKLENGFRLVVNTGADGGQTVDHLHIHLLGGRAMHWPPG